MSNLQDQSINPPVDILIVYKFSFHAPSHQWTVCFLDFTAYNMEGEAFGRL